jgi:hypothetical protein
VSLQQRFIKELSASRSIIPLERAATGVLSAFQLTIPDELAQMNRTSVRICFHYTPKVLACHYLCELYLEIGFLYRTDATKIEVHFSLVDNICGGGETVHWQTQYTRRRCGYCQARAYPRWLADQQILRRGINKHKITQPGSMCLI